MLTRCVIFLLWPVFALGQTPGGLSPPHVTHCPRVTRAEVPLYPPAARSAHLSGTVEIEVAVENGVVADATVKLGTVQTQVMAEKSVVEENQDRFLPYLSLPSVANVKTWQFEPKERTTFNVKYVYRIEGEETSFPENPKVELELPYLVTVTARPFKPTHSGCVP